MAWGARNLISTQPRAGGVAIEATIVSVVALDGLSSTGDGAARRRGSCGGGRGCASATSTERTSCVGARNESDVYIRGRRGFAHLSERSARMF